MVSGPAGEDANAPICSRHGDKQSIPDYFSTFDYKLHDKLVSVARQ